MAISQALAALTKTSLRGSVRASRDALLSRSGPAQAQTRMPVSSSGLARCPRGNRFARVPAGIVEILADAGLAAMI